MSFILFCFQPFHSCQQYCSSFFVWWKYLENITSLQKAISTNHLQNKLVHINCIFHSNWVADIIIWMSKHSDVAAENKSGLELLAGQAHLWFQYFGRGGGAALCSPCCPGVRWPGSSLAHACFGHIHKLFCLPFLEPWGSGVLGGSHLGHPELWSTFGHCFFWARKVCSVFGHLDGE